MQRIITENDICIHCKECTWKISKPSICNNEFTGIKKEEDGHVKKCYDYKPPRKKYTVILEMEVNEDLDLYGYDYRKLLDLETEEILKTTIKEEN